MLWYHLHVMLILLDRVWGGGVEADPQTKIFSHHVWGSSSTSGGGVKPPTPTNRTLFDRQTDGRTDRQTDWLTDRILSLDRVCIPCSAVKITAFVRSFTALRPKLDGLESPAVFRWFYYYSCCLLLLIFMMSMVVIITGDASRSAADSGLPLRESMTQFRVAFRFRSVAAGTDAVRCR